MASGLSMMPAARWNRVPAAGIMPPERAVLHQGRVCFSRTRTSTPPWTAAMAAARPQPPPPTTTTSLSKSARPVSRTMPVSLLTGASRRAAGGLREGADRRPARSLVYPRSTVRGHRPSLHRCSITRSATRPGMKSGSRPEERPARDAHSVLLSLSHRHPADRGRGLPWTVLVQRNGAYCRPAPSSGARRTGRRHAGVRRSCGRSGRDRPGRPWRARHGAQALRYPRAVLARAEVHSRDEESERRGGEPS
jgi:hypothetical protein